MIIFFNVLETQADRDFVGKLYEENRARLFHVANDILGNYTEAEDAVQEVFLKISENFERYSFQPYVNLIKIMNAIARNEANNILRDHQKYASVTNEDISFEEVIPDLAPDVLTQIIQKQDKELIERAMLQLSEGEREFLYLQYILGLMPKEIAPLFDLKPADVRKRMFAYRGKLAKILEGAEYAELYPSN